MQMFLLLLGIVELRPLLETQGTIALTVGVRLEKLEVIVVICLMNGYMYHDSSLA
jgi:hypothetical protein